MGDVRDLEDPALRRRLYALLAVLEPPLAHHETLDLEGYVDAGAPDAALDGIVDALCAAGVPVPSACLDAIDALAAAMDLTAAIARDRARIAARP
jgi:hypothetical protein